MKMSHMLFTALLAAHTWLFSSPNTSGSQLFTSGDAIPAGVAPGYPILGRLASQSFLEMNAAAGIAAQFTITAPAWSIDQIDVAAFGPSASGLHPSPQTVLLGIANDSGAGVPSPGSISQFTITGLDPEGSYSVNPVSLLLPRGSYWLVMLPATDSSTDFTIVGWNATATPGLGRVASTSNYGGSWFGNEPKPIPTFSLDGTVVPEPSSLTMLCLGAVALFCIARLNRKEIAV
jgi:hypothetical protein